MKDAFSAFDKDGNGSIDKHELMDVFQFSDDYDIKEIERMIAVIFATDMDICSLQK